MPTLRQKHTAQYQVFSARPDTYIVIKVTIDVLSGGIGPNRITDDSLDDTVIRLAQTIALGVAGLPVPETVVA
jgi:hypothetical protein